MDWLIIPACAALNRVRGGGLWAGFMWDESRGDKQWRGRPLYYVAPVIGVMAGLASESVWTGALWAFAYWLWGLPAHGRWFDLGRLPDGYAREGVEPDALERLIEWASFGSDHIALLWRHALVMPVLAWLAWPTGLLFPIAVVAAYELAWRVWPKAPIPLAELLTGVVWGVLILAAT